MKTCILLSLATVVLSAIALDAIRNGYPAVGSCAQALSVSCAMLIGCLFYREWSR